MAALVGEMVRVWGGSVSKGWSVVDGGWQVTRGGEMLKAIFDRCGPYELVCVAWRGALSVARYCCVLRWVGGWWCGWVVGDG